ncbi:ssDNA endonuclease and repair protein rad10 [Tulasnella sp. 419]|nr:ssDNA endonuclease and repair protein rad10 [Tulasnella sp. 419]
MASSASSNQPATSRAPPVAKPVVQRSSRNSILVNRRQEQNPLLEHLRNVAWEYAAISPDFQVGATTCALFLSLRYYRLHPEYLHRRISDLGNSYQLRLLLFMIDAKDPENEIKELTKVGLINNITIMANFATMSRATYEELNLLPGFGKVKARRVKDAFEKPFRNGPKSSTSNKGKAKELTDQSAAANTAPPGSPEWDVDPELISALEDDLTNTTNRDKTVTTSAPTRTGEITSQHKQDDGQMRQAEPPGSPDWDIDLDLNPDFDDMDITLQNMDKPQTKRRKPNP